MHISTNIFAAIRCNKDTYIFTTQQNYIFSKVFFFFANRSITNFGTTFFLFPIAHRSLKHGGQDLAHFDGIVCITSP